MEPKALNTLVDESVRLKEETRESVATGSLDKIEHLFGNNSLFFDEEVLAKWRLQGRFDELIDYILYQYPDKGGEDLWKQVLLDLRLKKDDEKCFRLLDGLLVGRLELLKVSQKNNKKFPGNYLVAAEVAVHKGEVMKVLYEYAYIVENRPPSGLDKALSKKIKDKVSKLLSS